MSGEESKPTEEPQEDPTSPASGKEKKIESFSKHANLFQSLFAGHSSLHSSTSSISARNPRELEKTQEELRGKYSKLEREKLEQIWDEFDANKDGQLSKAENEALVRAYFNNMSTWFPKMMDELLTQSLGFLDKTGSSAPAFEKMSESMEPLYNEMFESVQKDVPQMADEMWGVMDLNHDGKVTKDEFLTTFDSCSDDIVNKITRRVLYCVFANGNIDFAQFITDVDKETPNPDSETPDADAISLEHELKGKFNEAVRDTAREELQRTTEPCSTDEFWHKVCTRLRGWLGGLNDPVAEAARGAAAAGATPQQPFGAPFGYGGFGFQQPGVQFDAFGRPVYGSPFGFGQFGQFGLQQQQLLQQQQQQQQQAAATPAAAGASRDAPVAGQQANTQAAGATPQIPQQQSQFTPQLFSQMQQQIQFQQAQLQQAQAAARAAEAQAQAAQAIAAQAQAQAKAALSLGAQPPQQQAPGAVAQPPVAVPPTTATTEESGEKSAALPGAGGEGLSPAAAAHFAATGQQSTLPAGFGASPFGQTMYQQPFGQPMGYGGFGVPPPFPSFSGGFGF